MIRRTPRARLLGSSLAVALLAFPLGACGGDTDTGDVGKETPTAPPTADDGDAHTDSGQQDDP